MQLTFLGTSAGWPLPRLGCSCEICTSTDPRDKRLRPALLVNKSILLDAPIDIYHELQALYPKPYREAASSAYTLSTILLTHTHPDHIIGLYDLAKVYNSKVKPTVVATEGIIKEIRRSIIGVSLSRGFEIKIVKPFEQLLVDGIHASYIPVEHGSVETYGIKLKERLPAQAGKIIFYAPEFRKIIPSMRRHISRIDLLIIDGSSLEKVGQTHGHENIREGIRLAHELRPKKVLFTNIGHKTLPHEQLELFVKENGGGNFGIAYDGIQLEV